MPKAIHAHKLVAECAHELAHIVFDNLMSNDAIWTEWKRQHPGATRKGLESIFVKRYVAQCLPAARATLGGMLAQPYDEDLKDRILEALIADKTLIAGRANPAEIIGSL